MAPQLGNLQQTTSVAFAPAFTSAAAAAVPLTTSILPAPVSSVVNALPSSQAFGAQSLPNIPGLTVPAGTALSVTVPTTVPLAQTAIVSSLAALPENANILGLASVLDVLDSLPLPTSALPGDLPLSSLPTNIVSILPVDLPLSLPLSAPLSALPTGIIASLPANLPGNLPLSALPIQIPALPTGLPIVPIDSVSPVIRILETLGETLIGQLASQLSSIIATIASAAGGLPLGGLPSSPLAGVSSLGPLNSLTRTKDTSEDKTAEKKEEKRQLGGLLGGVEGATNLVGGLTGPGSSGTSAVTGALGNLGAITGVLSGLTGGVGGAANPLALLGNIPVVGGLAYGNLGQALAPVTNLVSNADNGGSTPLETVSGLIGGLKGGVQGIVNGLTLNGGPLSAVTGVLGNLGLGSIVLNVVESLPIPTNLGSIIQGIRQAAIAPAASILNATKLGQIANILAITNLLAVNNVGQLTSLADLTNLPAVQTAVQTLGTEDLLTVLDVLNSGEILAKRQVGIETLLASPLEFVKVVQNIVPLVSNPSGSIAFLILQQLGLGGLDSLVPTAALSGLLGGLNLPIKA